MSNLFRVGLENAAAATLLAIAAFAASRFLKRSPALVHAFLLLVLLKLVTPPLWSVPVIFDPVPPAPETWATVEARPDLILFDSPSLALAEPAVMVPEIAKVAPLDFVQTIDMESEPEVTLALSGSPEPRDANAATLPVIDWGQAFGVIWLVGSAVTLVVSVLAIRRFVRVLALAKPASPTVELHVEEAAARIGLARIPETFLIDWDRPPMVWAMGRRPSLMIPTALWARLDPGQRDTLLIHELAHLKRGDHLVRWLELAVSVLFWWLPVVWWTRRALRETEEDCCDAWVIWALPKSARCYADTLVETVDFLSESRTQAPLLASGFGHVRHLKRRLKMIMQGNTTRRLRLREGLAGNHRRAYRRGQGNRQDHHHHENGDHHDRRRRPRRDSRRASRTSGPSRDSGGTRPARTDRRTCPAGPPRSSGRVGSPHREVLCDRCKNRQGNTCRGFGSGWHEGRYYHSRRGHCRDSEAS